MNICNILEKYRTLQDNSYKYELPPSPLAIHQHNYKYNRRPITNAIYPYIPFSISTLIFYISYSLPVHQCKKEWCLCNVSNSVIVRVY